MLVIGFKKMQTSQSIFPLHSRIILVASLSKNGAVLCVCVVMQDYLTINTHWLADGLSKLGCKVKGTKIQMCSDTKLRLEGLSNHLIIIIIIISYYSSGTAMLGVLLILSLSSLVDLVPPTSASPAPCKRCCDDLEPAEGSGAQPLTGGFSHVPEVRTYINMTILKGTQRTHCCRQSYIVDLEGLKYFRGKKNFPPKVWSQHKWL